MSSRTVARRIAIVDDHPIVRRGLAELIGGNARFEIAAEASSAEEALELFPEMGIDLVLADLILGDGPDGIQFTKAIKADHPMLPVLVLSGRDETLFAERALLAGASGYLMKEEAVEVLLDAIDTAMAGGVWVSPVMSRRLLPAALAPKPGDPALTDDVSASLISELHRGNRTVAGISRSLGTTQRWVDRGLDALMERLHLPSRAALFLFVQGMAA